MVYAFGELIPQDVGREGQEKGGQEERDEVKNIFQMGGMSVVEEGEAKCLLHNDDQDKRMVCVKVINSRNRQRYQPQQRSPVLFPIRPISRPQLPAHLQGPIPPLLLLITFPCSPSPV